MATSIEVLDLGINNLASLVRGLRQAAKVEVRVVAGANQSEGADLMVLPGVGAFGAAVDEMSERGLDTVLRAHVAAGGPLFGVCLGMQLLTAASEESPGVPGLGFIGGDVRKLRARAGARVPNMGWGGAIPTAGSRDFPSLANGVDYYFVHSYAVHPSDEGDVLTWSEFAGERFASGLVHDNVVGVQFHPEKSSFGGQRLLGEVVEWALG